MARPKRTAAAAIAPVAPGIPGAAVFGHTGGVLGQSILVIDGAKKNGKKTRYDLAEQTWIGTIRSGAMRV